MSGTLLINLEISHDQAFMCFTPRSPPVFFKPKHTTSIILMGQQFCLHGFTMWLSSASNTLVCWALGLSAGVTTVISLNVCTPVEVRGQLAGPSQFQGSNSSSVLIANAFPKWAILPAPDFPPLILPRCHSFPVQTIPSCFPQCHVEHCICIYHNLFVYFIATRY